MQYWKGKSEMRYTEAFRGEDNIEIETMVQTWQSEVPRTGFELTLTIFESLSKDFIPEGKKRKFMLDYDENKRVVQFSLFKIDDETKESSQTEKMSMIKFYDWIISFDDLEGTGLSQITAFSMQRDILEKIIKNVPYLAEKIKLKGKMRLIVDYDPQKKDVIFKHYEIKVKETKQIWHDGMSREAVLKHYGYEDTQKNGIAMGFWTKNSVPTNIRNLSDVLLNTLDFEKKAQVIFEYDPDFPRAYLKITGTKDVKKSK